MTQERESMTGNGPERDAADIRAAVIARIWILFVGVMAIGTAIASGKGCESEEEQPTGISSEFVTYPLEEHSQYGEGGGKVSPEFQAKVEEIAKKTKSEIDDSKVKENSLSLEDVQTILKEDGGEARLSEVKKEDRKYVYHPALDMYFSSPDFIKAKNWWISRGEDFFKETIVPHIKPDGTQVLDTEGHPMFLPSLFERDLHAIFEKTGVWLNVRWGIRDENGRLVIWGRSLQKCLDTGGAADGVVRTVKYYGNKWVKNREKLEKICSGAVKEDVAAKPVTPGNGHLAMDIDGWQGSKPAYDMLIKLGYTGGCESDLYPGDGRHFGVNTPKSEAKKKAKCLRKENLN